MDAVDLEPLTYFHAGSLFNLRELTGNALMARAIQDQSKNRYRSILPQDLEFAPTESTAIRNADLAALLGADVALFHFDGSDLDSGTVVEFMVAKFADIPAVVLRTDFRRAGDSHVDPWNLMLSDYPRTKQVIVHAMEFYQKHKHPERTLENSVDLATREVAERVILAFDEVRLLPPVLTPDLRVPVYRWLANFAHAGSTMPHLEQSLSLLLEGKVKRRLL